MKNWIVGVGLMILTLPAVAQKSEAFKRYYVNHTEFGTLLGRVTAGEGNSEITESKTSITAQTYNGIQLNPDLSVGLIAGMDWYKSNLVTPLAAGLRYQLGRKGNGRFFTMLDTGYGFTWFHKDNEGFDSKGGWMINPGIGMGLGKQKGLTFTLSWKRQHVFVEKPILWNQLDRYENRNYQRLVLRIGMSF